MITLDELTNFQKDSKIEDLLDMTDFETIEDAENYGICMNPGCRFITVIKSDNDSGYCEFCKQNTVASAYMLAGII